MNTTNNKVCSIFGSAKRGYVIHVHAPTEPVGCIAAGPYATKSEAKRKFKLSYEPAGFKAWNF